MKKFLAVILMALFFFSCSDEDKVPRDVLPKQKMQAVMWDMISAGEFLNVFVFYKDTGVNKTAKSEEWFNKIYQLHHITKDQFERSYEYYREHPALMKAIMDSLGKKYAAPEVTAEQNAEAAEQKAEQKVDSPQPGPGHALVNRDSLSLKRRDLLKKRPGGTIPDSVFRRSLKR